MSILEIFSSYMKLTETMPATSCARLLISLSAASTTAGKLPSVVWTSLTVVTTVPRRVARAAFDVPFTTAAIQIYKLQTKLQKYEDTNIFQKVPVKA